MIRDALSPDEVSALDAAYDRFPALANGEWYGNAQRRDYTADTGFELHNVLDCGDPAFDILIDHPSWVAHARHFAGEEGTYVQGIMLDEAVAAIRERGGHHPVHSGGHDASIRTQYSYRNGRFRCGQLNVLIALRDIGPGDGPTMIVPGSHKQNLSHPVTSVNASPMTLLFQRMTPATSSKIDRWYRPVDKVAHHATITPRAATTFNATRATYCGMARNT